MKIYIEVEKKVTEKVLIGRTCDWCDEPIPDTLYDNPETEIKFSVGTSTIYDSYGEGWSIDDLCVKCGEHLKEVLINLGIKVDEWDW